MSKINKPCLVSHFVAHQLYADRKSVAFQLLYRYCRGKWCAEKYVCATWMHHHQSIPNNNSLCVADSLSTRTMFLSLFYSTGRHGPPRCHTLYCQPRTEIRCLVWKPLIAALTGNRMGRRLVHRQCITDMPCMTLGESLRGFRCCNNAGTGVLERRCTESDDDTERVALSLSA